MDISPIIKEHAPLILAEIKKAKHILLHCHPSPDPDSVGSALSMKFALEQMGKKVTVIKGDSDIPRGFMHFPGVHDIVAKNFFEIDLSDYDLFIILDTAQTYIISRFKPIVFPLPIRSIVIDHHTSNPKFADLNLVESSYPATAQVLFDLFELWGIKLDANIASNLFIGMYTDTGGFKYPGVSERTFYIAMKLVSHIPRLQDLVSKMEASNTPGFMTYEGAVLSNITVHCGGSFAIGAVENMTLVSKNIAASEAKTSEASSFLLTVPEWRFVAVAVEIEPRKVKFSFRSSDAAKYDVSALAGAFGGGGHKAASGLVMNDIALEEAIRMVVSKAKELYNLPS